MVTVVVTFSAGSYKWGETHNREKMNYIVLDLEWNQPLSPQRMVRDPMKLSGEIIQFGAVRIDDLQDLNIVDKYSEIVKPVFYTKMNKHVTEVTDLTDEIISKGRPFEVVCREFLEWCGDVDCLILIEKTLPRSVEIRSFYQVVRPAPAVGFGKNLRAYRRGSQGLFTQEH